MQAVQAWGGGSIRATFLLILFVVVGGVHAADIRTRPKTLFELRKEYVYSYNSTASLPDSVSVTLARVHVWVVKETEHWQELHVLLKDVSVSQSHTPADVPSVASPMRMLHSDDSSWFSVKLSLSGQVDEVMLPKGHSIDDVTKLKLTIAELFNFDMKVLEPGRESSPEFQGTYSMQIDGDVTILTKTKPLADETNTILSHTQTSTLKYNTASRAATSILSQDNYVLNSMESSHPVPSQLQVEDLQDLTLLEVKQRRVVATPPDDAIRHQPQMVMNHKSSDSSLSQVRQCLKEVTMDEDCEQYVRDSLWSLSADEIIALATEFSKDDGLNTLMLYAVRSRSAQSQTASARLLLSPDSAVFPSDFSVKQLLKDGLFHWSGLLAPQQVLVDGLVRSCMTNRAGVFLDSSISGQCQLALGSMANSLLADPERQSSGQTVLDLLHNNLNKLMNGKDVCMLDEDYTISTVHAVAQAKSSSSLAHMQKLVQGSSCSVRVQREAVHAMATLPSDKVPGVLRDIASSDVHDWQVTEAAQHYGADIEHHRTRRQAMARAATPQQRVYYSASPSVNWHNEVGSRDIGASFGSSTTSNISQTVGYYRSTVHVDIEGRSWVQGQLGYIGRRSDLLEIRASATGAVTYDRDIMKDYHYGHIQEVASRFDSLYSQLASNISTSLQSLVARVRATSQATSLAAVFASPIAALMAGNQQRAVLHRDLLAAMQNVSQYTGNSSSPISDTVQHLQATYDLWETISSTLDNVYQDTAVHLSSDMPYIAAEWANSVDGMISSLAQFHSNPQQAIGSFNFFNIRLRAHIKDSERLLRRFQAACRKGSAANCSVLLTAEASRLANTTVIMNHWVSQLEAALMRSSDSRWTLALNTTLRELRSDVLPWLMRVTTQVTIIQSAVRTLMSTISTMQTESLPLNQAIEQAEGEWVRIAGLRFHASFPNRLRSCDDVCGCSQFPFTANDALPAGIPLAVTQGSQVVAPVNGIVRPGPTNTSLLFQPVGMTSSSGELVLYNIVPTASLLNTSQLLMAGSPLGSAIAQSQCASGSSSFLHVVVRSALQPQQLIDPTPFLSDSARDANIVEQWAASNYFIFVRGIQRQNAALRESLQRTNTEVTRQSNGIAVPTLATGTPAPVPASTGQAALSRQLPAYNFARIIATPASNSLTDSLWPAMNTDIADVINSPQPPSSLPSSNTLGNNFTVRELQQYLTSAGHNSSTDLTSALDSLAQARSQLTCEYLPTASTAHVAQTLSLLGLTSTGTRAEVLARLQGASNNGCSGLAAGIPVDSDFVYQFNSGCSGGTVCVDITSGFETRTMTFTFQYQSTGGGPAGRFQFALGTYTETHNIPAAGLMSRLANTRFMIDGREICVRFRVSGTAVATLQIVLCSLTADPHQDYRTILNSAQLSSSPSTPVNSSSILSWPVGQLQSELTFHQLSTPTVTQAFTDMYMAVLDKASAGRSSRLTFTNEFAMTRRFFTSTRNEYAPGLINFFEERVSLRVGAFPLTLVFGASGYVNVSLSWSLDASNYKATLNINPLVDMSTYGRVRMGSSQFAEASLTGRLVKVQYASYTESNFGPLPLSSRISINETLDNGRVVLATRLAENQINGGQRDLSNSELWQYVTIPETYELHREHQTPDTTPTTAYPFVSGTEPRLPTTTCFVMQLPHRSVTTPAFQLAVTFSDDDSRVENIQYYAGLAPGKSDVIQRQSLHSPLIVVPKTLAGGVPLFFTIEAGITGNKTVVACSLPTYDITLPQGLTLPAYSFTSHPNQMLATMAYWDDSSLWPTQWRAIGFEPSVQGRDVYEWESFNSQMFSTPPVGVSSNLDYFATPQTGQLVTPPLEESVNLTLDNCTTLCLDRAGCQAFDYSVSRSMCRILSTSRTSSVGLATVEDYRHYVRLGADYATQHLFTGLSLLHNQTFYINMILRNQLGHVAVISSRPVLVDMTPPAPDVLNTVANDTLIASGCSASSAQQCFHPTPIKNHRFIIDGPQSATVFNGHSPLSELRYTHINSYISAHWNGFSDIETGIWAYTWCVGSTIGQCDVVSRRNPHAHLLSASEWTNSGLARNLRLADGTYYITVQALNGAVYGGSLVTTVQHATGLVVDSTPPVIHSVVFNAYNATAQLLSFTVNASDAGSGLSTISYGLGRSPRDTLVQYWRSVSLQATGLYQVTTAVPDGVTIWVRVQIGNRAGLLSTASTATSFSIDASPPSLGRVLDGSVAGSDLDFQASSTMVCANWNGFVDADSGISHYLWSINTSNSAFTALPAARSIRADLNTACTTLTTPLPHGVTVYSTIVAVHASAGQLSTTATSNGVLVDITPPSTGQAVIGMNRTSSGQYWSLTNQLSAFWSGFNDSDSTIRQYYVSLLRSSASMTLSQADVVSMLTLPASQSSYDCYNHQWQDGDRVQVQVAASNGAQQNTTVSSQVVTVDSSPPIITSLLDGLNPLEDQRYVTVNDTLSAHWQAEDRQSSIAWYEVSVQQLSQGNRVQIWPSLPAGARRLNASETNFTTNSAVLSSGSRYTVALSVKNGAGLVSHAESNGVLVDTVPPIVSNLQVMSSLPLGLQPANTDSNGHIVISNRQSLAVTFQASDSHSGVASSRVGIQNTADDQYVNAMNSVGGFVDFEREASGYLERLNLTVGDATNGPFYRVVVQTEDNAGLQSEMLRSPLIRVVANDTAGVVLDGGDPMADIDYQSDDTALTATFRDFETQTCDIEHVLWTASTRQDDAEDEMAFTSRGLTVTSAQPRQASGHILCPRADLQGREYFITVRVVTACGTMLESTSDGVIIDRTRPSVMVTSTSNQLDVSTPQYISDSTQSVARWEVTEGQSLIQETRVAIGSYPGGQDIQRAQQTDATSLERGQGLMGQEGLSRYVTVTSTNTAGVTGQVTALPIVYDATPPVAGKLSCSPSLPVSRNCSMTCTWSEFRDRESGIAAYEISLGTWSGSQDVYDRTRLPLQTASFTFSGLTCTGTEIYYPTVRAVNGAEQSAAVFGAAIRVDNTPPMQGMISVLSNQVRVTMTAGASATVQEVNATCLLGSTRLTVSWSAFEDPESGIARYSIGLGTAAGSDDIRSFLDIPLPNTEYTFTALNTSSLPSTLIFVTVRAYNRLNMVNSISTEGIVFVSRQQAQQFVRVGNTDINTPHFQIQTSSINATWSPSNRSCATSLQWKIVQLNSPAMAIQNYLNVSTNTSDGVIRLTNNNLVLSNGYTYRVIVQAMDIWGGTQQHQSQGIGVASSYRLEPGMVSDGPYRSGDINYQLSQSEISATWTEFGDGTDAGQIDSYWLAIGTDRRYAATRTNVLGFINVAKNTSYTAYNLSLTQFSVKYYVTVRAVGASGATSEATSNGLFVGYSATVIAGQVTLTTPDYQSSNNTIQATWRGFSSQRGIVRYEWAVSVGQRSAMELLMVCNVSDPNLIFTSVSKNTKVTASGLQLKHGTQYHMIVRAIDQSEDCIAAQSAGVVVDATPPTIGDVIVGFNSRAAPGMLTYSRSRNILNVTWSGFADVTSGIDHYEIGAFALRNCSIANSLDTRRDNQLGAFYKIGLSTSYTFTGLNLVPNQSHVIQLRAVNRAMLTTTATSSPFLVDKMPAVVGEVHDGADWTSDRQFQNSSSDLWATFAHVNTLSSAVPCRRSQSHPLISPTPSWTPLSGSFADTAIDQKLIFVPTLVTHGSPNGTSLQMLGNLSSNRVDAAAYRTTVNMAAGGNVSFEIQSANGDESLANHSVTSVVLWLGDAGTTTEYTVVSSPASRSDSATLTRNSQALGLQIHPAYNGNTSRLLAWSRRENDTTQVESVWFDLAYNPSAAFHTYTLSFKTNAVTDLWTMNVLVDGHLAITMAGIPPLRRDTNFVAQLWNRDSFIPARQAVPREVTAHIRNVQFPVPTGNACDNGRPFYAMQSPVVWYEAAVGTLPGASNVQDYKEIFYPCRGCPPGPCQLSWTACNTTCSSLVPDVIKVHLTGLDLAKYTTNNTGQLVCTSRTQCDYDQASRYATLPTFFITIRATNGAGLTSASTSDGVRVDQTPPTVERRPQHFDVDFSLTESIQYQSSNSTIYASWRFVDLESDIVEYEWAIGTSEGGTDLQDYVSVGLQTTAANRMLAGRLVHNGEYYVMVRGRNGAGLYTEASSTGVILITTTINQTQAQGAIQPLFTSPAIRPVNVTIAQYTQSANVEQAGISWEGVNADVVYWRIGTDVGSEDILPSTRINTQNISDQIASVINATVSIGNITIANISELTARAQGRAEQTSDNFFRLEPGRLYHQRLDVCNLAIRCTAVDVTPSLAFRPAIDRLVTGVANRPATIYIGQVNQSRSAGPLSTADTLQYVNINATDALAEGETLAAGLLSSENIQQRYSPSVSFISNPVLTSNQASRQLTGRFVSLAGPSFFVTPISNGGLMGPIRFSSTFETTRNWDGFNVVVLFWNYASSRWQNIRDSCGVDPVVNWTTSMISGQICSGNVSTTVTSGRVRRQAVTQSNFLMSEMQLIVAQIINTTVNTAPRLVFTQTQPYLIAEDRSAVTLDLADSVRDNENDQGVFNLTSVPARGTASITDAGLLMYTPCKDCTGLDQVTVTFTETQQEALPPYTTSATFSFNINNDNDPPHAFLFTQPAGSRTIHHMTTLQTYAEANHSTPLLVARVGMYDYDSTHDTLTYLVETTEPLQGTLDVVLDLQANGASTSMPVDWPANHTAELFSGDILFTIANITYTPPSLGFTGTERFSIYARDSQSFLSSPQLSIIIDVLPSYCQNGGQCSRSPTDSTCSDIAARRSSPESYTCTCPASFSGDYCEINSTATVSTSTACPPNAPLMKCANNPCANAVCPGQDTAVCRPNYCGACQAEWFVGSTPVQCSANVSSVCSVPNTGFEGACAIRGVSQPCPCPMEQVQCPPDSVYTVTRNDECCVTYTCQCVSNSGSCPSEMDCGTGLQPQPNIRGHQQPGWCCPVYTYDDIDECGVENGGCSHTCVNALYSHSCTCPAGMNLHPDARTCGVCYAGGEPHILGDHAYVGSSWCTCTEDSLNRNRWYCARDYTDRGCEYNGRRYAIQQRITFFNVDWMCVLTDDVVKWQRT